jgi:1-acyl-sn-glycerol-3-phosphate acyltransferase
VNPLTGAGVHAEPPRTDLVPHPRRRLLHGLRPTARAAVHRWWDVDVAGAERFPPQGPVVVVGNHVGFIDGPLMTILGPRAVHALTKKEMFTGPLGALLTGAGQIPLERFHPDPRAIRLSLRVLRDQGVVGVFPEGTRGGGELKHLKHGAAYLAMVTGATVQPVIFLGTRLPGGSNNSLPPRGTRISITYGEPLTFDASPWPRRKPDVAEAAVVIGQALRDTLASAQRRTGIALPGPIPSKEPS